MKTINTFYLYVLLIISTQLFAETKITSQITQLSQLGIKPVVFNKELQDFQDDLQLIKYLNSYVPIKDGDDLYQIFTNQIAFHRGRESVDKDLLSIYDIFFNGSWKPEEVKITVFSGGSGSNRLTSGLLDYTPRIDMLINAYDDLIGTSNGSIRREFNVLGPSDIIKNLVVLLDSSYSENTPLKRFLEYRLSKSEDLTLLRVDLDTVAANRSDFLDQTLSQLFNNLTPRYRQLIASTFDGFLQKVREWESTHAAVFDLRDFAVRNIVYTGLLFIENYQHTRAIQTFKEQFHVKPNIILNNEEGLWLVGLTTKGNLLNSEGDLCKSCLDEEIDDVYIFQSLLSEEEELEFYNLKTQKEKKSFLESHSIPIIASHEASESIHSAQMILFAPTTFYSNVVPTLKTIGIKEQMYQSKALKIFIANLTLERGNKNLSHQIEDLQHFLSSDNEIDYVIANLSEATTKQAILVDGDRIRSLGLELIELAVADPRQGGLHRSDIISKVVMQLQALESIGYEISEGCCRQKNMEEFQFEARLQEYLGQTYHALFVDVDGTITDDSKEVPDGIISKFHDYIASGIFLGINTARTDKSLEQKLLVPLSKALEQNPEYLKRVYVYSNNGSHGYILDGTTLYEHKISQELAENATTQIRNELLDPDEPCSITPYKITILPNTKKNPDSLVSSINELLHRDSFPFIARLGADPGSNPSIIITNYRTNKRLALLDFISHSNIPNDAILKIGDKGALGGVDYDWLIGMGSFSVDEFDVNGTHVPLLLLEGQKGIAGTLWILERAKIYPGDNL